MKIGPDGAESRPHTVRNAVAKGRIQGEEEPAQQAPPQKTSPLPERLELQDSHGRQNQALDRNLTTIRGPIAARPLDWLHFVTIANKTPTDGWPRPV